ncbi:MAG TPA: pyruvate/2-oxoglutarate dehydrogenase complex dihydrolipoamide dehydrogenase [Cytophagales bacterium]|nr:pyruvate/2-oxoglutarate dehydrogenase complex dihydrolipoamide dehydrogenase [Cytophagales bacterium]
MSDNYRNGIDEGKPSSTSGILPSVLYLSGLHLHRHCCMKTYDHIILGTGQATGTLLGRLIPTGDSIAVIEGGKVGGSCVNYGCTPTKTMVASAKALHQARRGDFFGFETGDIKLNYARVRERMNEIRNGGSDGLTHWMESTENVELIRGWGEFAGPKTLRVNDQEITGKKIYINTGTHPFVPPIDGIKDVPHLDSGGLLDLEELPGHLLILGGGYIGVEFSQVFRRFGSKVTLIQGGEQLMPREDADIANTIQDFLEEEGVEVMLTSKATRAQYIDGQVHLTVMHDGETKVVTGTHLLVATGRRPNSKQLNLKAAGIEINGRGFIEVNDYCETVVEGVYALGDVNGHGAFTHTSVNDAEITLDHMFGGSRKISNRIPIYGLFTDPPLGRVGLTEKAALEKGYKIMKATRPMSKIARAKEMGETKGIAKLIVDADTDLILGASILGPGGDEIINMFAAIMHSGIPCRSYREVVLVHPTVSELMPWILDGLQLVE